MAIYSLPSLRQPESISPQFYFSSQSFVGKAQTDIETLVGTWAQAVKALPTGTHYHKKQPGPFLKFKAIYARLGWIYIHLAVVDPALRKPWFSTLARLLLAYLRPAFDPLKQIAAVFALWALWGTQPPEPLLGPKHYIVIDTETRNYLDAFPADVAEHLNRYFKDAVDEAFEQTNTKSTANSSNKQSASKTASHSYTSLSSKHRAHLDPNIFGPPPPVIKPSDSVYQVLKNLRDQHAFVIQPTQIALVYPPLPTNRITLENPSSQPQQQQQQIQLLDHPPQTSQRPSSPSSTIPNDSSNSALNELIMSTRDELERSQKDNPLSSLCDPVELNRLRTSYLSTKAFLTGHPQSSLSSSPPSPLSLSSSSTPPPPPPPLSSSAEPGARRLAPDRARHHQPDPLTRELFVEAIGMTRKVIQKTGPGLDHLLFPKEPASSSRPNDQTHPDSTNDTNIANHPQNHNDDDKPCSSLDAFFLVDQAQSIPDLPSLLANTPQT
jgi:hypothetical protein